MKTIYLSELRISGIPTAEHNRRLTQDPELLLVANANLDNLGFVRVVAHDMLARKLDVKAVAIARLVEEVAVRRPNVGLDLDLVRVDHALRACGLLDGVPVDAVVEAWPTGRADRPVDAELVIFGGTRHGVWCGLESVLKVEMSTSSIQARKVQTV